ncbi:MAG: hypothetical protein HYZ48_02715, partial [Chlamydiales bacterium]|nr:hypothetical protein [Chlamydiales bacterium]
MNRKRFDFWCLFLLPLPLLANPQGADIRSGKAEIVSISSNTLAIHT